MPVSGSGDIAFTGADELVTGVNHIGLAGSFFFFIHVVACLKPGVVHDTGKWLTGLLSLGFSECRIHSVPCYCTLT